MCKAQKNESCYQHNFLLCVYNRGGANESLYAHGLLRNDLYLNAVIIKFNVNCAPNLPEFLDSRRIF